MNRANLGKVDLTRAIDANIRLEAELTPNADAQFIARADHKVRGNRRHIKRSKCGWHIPKQVGAIDRQDLTRARSYKLLKFGEVLWNPLVLIELILLVRLTRILISIGIVPIHSWSCL